MTDPDEAPEAPNEILRAAREVRDQARLALEATAGRTRSWPLAKIGIGVGIGSAAIAGAVLFASRSRPRK